MIQCGNFDLEFLFFGLFQLVLLMLVDGLFEEALMETVPTGSAQGETTTFITCFLYFVIYIYTYIYIYIYIHIYTYIYIYH